MKLKLYACLVAGAALSASQAFAALTVTPFLSVDINGANYGGGQSVGATQAGFLPWNAFQGFDQLDDNYDPDEDFNLHAATGFSKTFASSEGNITATLFAVGPGPGARNRGNQNALDPAPALLPLDRDLVFVQRPADTGLGRGYFKLTLAGLIPGQRYEMTGYARDINFDGAAQIKSFQAWSDLARLGVDGPAAWLDAHVGAGASYQPTDSAPAGYKNPIPKFARSRVTGPNDEVPYPYEATFRTLADGSGVATIYTWADFDAFDGQNVQLATVLNGFEIGVVPEPTSFALFGLGLVGAAGLRRRVR